MPAAEPVHAQARRGAVEATGGWVGFADDGVVEEAMVGAQARVYVSPRVGIGPELVYISGRQHSHTVLTGNVTLDLLSPGTGMRRLTPYVVAGAGLFTTRQDVRVGTFSSAEGAFTAGGGVRVLAGNRIIVGAEARIGWELHLRVNGLVGWRFGG